jgi:hypothetical protein
MAVGHYRDAARDAERALQNNYPDAMRFRLHLRRALCFRELGDEEKSSQELRRTRESIAKSAFPDDKKEELLGVVERSFSEEVRLRVPRVKIGYVQPPELSYGAGHFRPCLSSAVLVNQNEKFGRHWVANRDLKTGKLSFFKI